MEEILTPQEVQELLKLKTVESVTNYRKQGKITGYKHPLSGRWIYKRSEIQNIIDSVGK